MFYRTIFMFLIGFVLAESVANGPLGIVFNIETEVQGKNGTKIICDHSFIDTPQKYTVLEGEEFTITTKHNSFINHFNCNDRNNETHYSYAKKDGYKNVTTFKGEKRMGNLWNCTVLTNRNTPSILPVVRYPDANFAAAYCFMKIHVRQTTSPQTILVNNMVLQPVRTDLSEKDVDFIAVYQYADGDVVNVTCINFLNPAPLTMEYAMAGTMSDNSTMEEISSDEAIGFVAKLHSGHNNSYMTCTNKEPFDYTKVMVRFVMETEFKNIISININGRTLRPKLKIPENHHYEMEYKYLTNQFIVVVCEVQKTGSHLSVSDKIDFLDKVSSYKKKVLIFDKKTQMSFSLNATDEKKLKCSSENDRHHVQETLYTKFTAGKFSIDPYALQMELPSNGTVMELFNTEKLKVIYYEFNEKDTLQLKCGPLLLPKTGPVLYIELKEIKDSDSENCSTNKCNVSKTFHLTKKTKQIVCYLKEQVDLEYRVLREIRVMLSERVPTTTSSTTPTTTTGQPGDANPSAANIASGASPEVKEQGLGYAEKMALTCVAVGCIIIICVSTVIVKLRKRNHSQGQPPHDRNYQNLQNPSETSIPAYPPQWESNYAVPIDRRAEDAIYSAPCQEPALYSTPTPKHLRNQKQKPVDPTYAVLQIPNARGRKNIFKETDEPNYAEVYANRQEQCYAKVLPKSVRNKMVQDNNPYSYVTAAAAEPVYCEPAIAQGGPYANVNNAHYANSTASEYVEPTYCELQKRTK